MADKKILLFSMDTFDRLMDRVDEYFGTDDVQVSPMIYREQIAEDPYSRWFAYDVTRNHLRYYQRYKVYDIEFMNNRRGPRWAFYPAVMAIIDELVDDGGISIVSFDKYRSDPVWIDGESIGIVGRYDVDVDYLYEMEGGDKKLEYLDLRFNKWSGVERRHVRIRLTEQLYRRLRHVHMLFETNMNGVIYMSGPAIKYFSVDNHGFTGSCNHIRLDLSVDSDVRVDYLQLNWLGVYGISLQYMGVMNNVMARLVDMHTRYIDVRSSTAILYTLVHSIFGTVSDEYMTRHGPSEWPRLTHLGFENTTNGDDVRNVIKVVRDRMKFLHRLTSLDIPLMNAHIPIVNSLSDQLIYVGLRYVRRANNFTMPTKLKYVKVLDLSLPPDVDDMANIKIGRWNLPETCRVLSLYSPRVINELNMNFDLTKFRNLNTFMTTYHRNLDQSWIRPIFPNVSVVNYPYSRKAILTPTDFEITWKANREFNRLSTNELVDLLKQVVPRNNPVVFLKREMMKRFAQCIRS